MLMDQALRVGACHSRFHALQTLTGEGLQQKLARGNFVDAARPQVEQSIFFDLADGRTVGALHVVGVDFQLRLGVNLRVVGKQQVAVRLLGVGFLRVFVHDDAAVENPVRMAIQDSVVELAAAAVWAGVLYVHVIVEMLVIVAHEDAVDQTLSTFAGQHWVDIVADQSAAKQQRMGGNVRAAFLLNAQRRNVERVQALALDHVMRNRRVRAGKQFGRAVAEDRSAANRDVVFDDRGLALLLENQQIPRMNHARSVGCRGHKQQMNRRIQRKAAANVHERTIFSKGRVQGAKCITLNIQMAAEVSFKRGRVLLDLFLKARDCDAGWQSSEYRQAADELSIDKHQLHSRAFHSPRLQIGV